MSWDDWVFGAATRGIYNWAKTAYKAGKAADKAGENLEEFSEGAGSALAVIGSTVNKLGQDMSSFLRELGELLTIKRVAPRNEDDLWNEEVERLKALKKQETDLEKKLEELEASDDEDSWNNCFWGSIFGMVSYEELVIRTKLAVVRKAINEIFYEEPGTVSNSIHNIQNILERFNTLEQPRLEEILDSVNDNLEESKEILEEVKKLFVVKTWKAVNVAELSEKKRKELEVLEASLTNFDQLIAKNTAVSAQLQKALIQSQPSSFQMEKMVGTSFKISNEAIINREITLSNTGASSIGDSSASINDSYTHPLKPKVVFGSGPSFALKSKVSTIATQPMAMSIATALNHNAVIGYLDNYHTIEGRARYYMREKLKVEKAIYRIKWVSVEEPGMIPKILEEIRPIIERFRSESQPRVEKILDSVNVTVAESTEVLTNINKSLMSVQGAFKFLSKYSLLIKIGLAVVGALVLLIFLMLLIMLFRQAFGI